jgi:arabinofuranosyltransferase
MAMGVVCTSAAVLIALLPGRSAPRIVLVGALLVLSNAFIEYATSGLENALGYLLFAVVIGLSLRPGGQRQVLLAVVVGALVAAAVLTRMDYLLLLAPAGGLWVWQRRHEMPVLLAAAGAAIVPVALWFAWAYATYGYLLPATFEAKTNLAIPRGQLIETGWYYLSFSLRHDPATVVLLVLAAVAVARWGTGMARGWLLGVATYLGYVVWIGGDFMVGRFLAVPLLICAALVVRVQLPASVGRLVDGDASSATRGFVTAASVVATVALAGVILGSTATSLARPTAQRWEPMTIVLSDERGVYAVKYGGIVDYLRGIGATAPQAGADTRAPMEMITTPLRQIETAAQNWPSAPDAPRLPDDVVATCGGLGVIGVMSGPDVHVVDECALTDRFLAALPGGDPNAVALPGHMRRQVPDGYLDAVRFGDPARVVDPVQSARLAEVWERIRSQTSAN